MADLDNSLIMAAGFSGIVKQAGASAELVCSKTLTQGECYVFEFTVMTVDPDAASGDAIQYSASFIVAAVWDTSGGGGGATWRTGGQAANVLGTASVTWAASMNGNVLEVTANGDTGWLHMASLKAGVKTEFAAQVGAS